MYSRARLLGAGICLVGVFLGCSDRAGNGPTGPQFAKGGGKGKPGAEPTLQEYWVIPSPEFGNLIHVAGDGSVDAVNPGVVFDHFFNGIRDDDPPSDAHYEYFYAGPPATVVEQFADGTWHVDIPWNGDRGQNAGLYRNSPVTDVHGSGADPFAFRLRFDLDGDRVGVEYPQGVTVGGVAGEPSATVVSEIFPEHGTQVVRSYATFLGATSQGTASIAALTMTSPQCTLETTTTGKGKPSERVTVTVRAITATVGINLALAGPVEIPPDNVSSIVWIEFHYRDATTGAITSRQTVTLAGESTSMTVYGDLPAGESFPLEFVIDYVYPIGDWLNYVYDPGQNNVATTAGFGIVPWSGPQTSPMPQTTPRTGLFPVATTGTAAVTCQ